MASVWFITGCHSPIEREVAKLAIARGDHVIAASRRPEALTELQKLGAYPMRLDVTAPMSELRRAVSEAESVYGPVNYLVNGTAYVAMGAVEETGQEETLAQFATNFFGPANFVRAFLPLFRERRSGTIALIGSFAAWEGIPGLGLYCASRAALSKLADSLNREVDALGIKVCHIEMGYFRPNTHRIGENVIPPREEIDDYKITAKPIRDALVDPRRELPNDSLKGAAHIVELLTGSGLAKGHEFPRRVALGKDAVQSIRHECQKVLKELDEWEEFSTTVA